MFAKTAFRMWFSMLVLVMMTACTTMQPLGSISPADISAAIEIGDEVEVSMTTGEVLEITVDEVTSKGLRGDGQFVDYTDVESIAVRDFDNARTGKAILITAGVIVGVGFLLHSLEEAAEVYTGSYEY